MRYLFILHDLFILTQPLLDDYFQNRSIDTPRMLRLWTWEDSTKMVNFLNQELHRARIFGKQLNTLANLYILKDW